MYKTFEDIMAAVRGRGPVTVSVAGAQDPEVLQALKEAREEGLAEPILVGEAALIAPLARAAGLEDAPIIDESDPDETALRAAELVRQGRARVLMKGLINSRNFLKAVLDKDRGLRRAAAGPAGARLLSHLGVFEVPGGDRLLFISDGGLNVAPDLAAKRDILLNGLEALGRMGLSRPNVAVMSHNEQVSDKIPSTVDAAALAAMGARGELPPCVIEGPVAMDVAASAEAARHKKIDSRISGAVDFFLMPNIEAGNLVGKTLTHYARAKFAGLILGALAPVVLTSRSDSPEAKLHSLALAALQSQG